MLRINAVYFDKQTHSTTMTFNLSGMSWLQIQSENTILWKTFINNIHTYNLQWYVPVQRQEDSNLIVLGPGLKRLNFVI